MADISQIKAPDGSVYDVKDTSARDVLDKQAHVFYVEGASTDTAGVWTGAIQGLEAYYNGLTILYRNVVAGSSSTTLNINGLGAKTCYMTGGTLLTTHYAVGSVILLTYYNNAWRRADYNTNTTYSVFNSLNHGNGSFIAGKTVYRYQLLFHTDADHISPLNVVNNGYNSTSKEIDTSMEFDPFGEIYYYITTSTVSADAAFAATYLTWSYGSVDLRYSLNISASVNALTAHKDVYIKVAPQANGKVKLSAAFPLVQELPLTNDGYWYIYLGRAYSTYQMALYHHHEVYYHNGITVVQKLPSNTDVKYVNGHTVERDIPSSAALTDTTNADGVSGASINRFAMCSTAANVESKVADIESGSLILEDGARVTVFFTNPNTTSMPTLNVNDTGAKRVLIGTHDSTTSLVLVDGQENLLSGACDFVYSDSYEAWVLMNSGATARNEVVYSQTAPTNALKGTLWVKPAQSTVAETKCLVVTASGVSSLPLVINNGNITSDMVVIGHEFSNRFAMVGDIAWTTANGSVTLSGTIDGSTNVVLYLLRSR